MQTAYALARQSLPEYSSKFSRHDFTLGQLFACLVVKEHLQRSYRGAEALLRDCRHWCRDIGLPRVPDHNTLQRAAAFLLSKGFTDRLMDTVVHWAVRARKLGLSTHPSAIDSTTYESHHVSRHYEHRCHQTRRRMQTKTRQTGRKSTRAETLKGLPKLGLAVASACHLAVSLWTGTGAGADHPHFEPLLRQARRRLPHRQLKAAGDAGYDSEPNHRLAREELGVASLIPPKHGRPPQGDALPSGRWRGHMKRLLASKASRRRCGFTQRWQVETVNSMMKRNLSSALRGRSAWSRKRDMALKVITHNVMILKWRVETEQ